MEIKKVHSTMTFPKVETSRQVYDYYQSVKTLKELYWKAYEWDKPRHSPEVELVAAQRIHDVITIDLEDKREQCKLTRTRLDNQWIELEQKQLKLKRNIRKMNTFIKTNLGKRERAIYIREEEERVCEQRVKDIANIRHLIEKMNETKKTMDRQIYLHRLYEKFLEETISVSGEFKSVIDLINRYDALSTTKDDLGDRQTATMKELEAARAKIIRMTEDYSLRILGLNNTLANLNARYKIAVNKALHWESLVWAIRKYSFEKYKELNQVKLSTRNLYVLMCRRKDEIAKVEKHDFENQLIFIKKTLQELEIVNGRAQAAIRQMKPSSVKGNTSHD